MGSASQIRGMSLLVIIVLFSMVSLSIGIAAPVVFQVIDAARTADTQTKLEELKIALTGNPGLLIENGRADFGYMGTMGSVPTDLSQLWQKDSQPSHTFDDDTKVDAGWVGPYVPNQLVERLLSLEKDPFGNDWVYTSTPFNRALDNQAVAARILSVGPDGVADTDDDMRVDILESEVFSTVTGKLTDDGSPAAFATVTLNVPVDGVVSQRLDVTDGHGDFEFDAVSFGFRSVSIDPKLTLTETDNTGSGVKFKVTNYGTDNVSITSIRATYTSTPASFYEKVNVAGTDVFDYGGGTRNGSGDLVTFSAEVVEGSGNPSQIVPIRVNEENTVTPDLEISGVGGTIEVEFFDFKDQATGSANAVDLEGVTMVINFSDGSENTFVVPAP